MIQRFVGLLAIPAAMAAADLVWDVPSELRRRPGTQVTYTYSIDPAPTSHTLEITNPISGVSVTVPASTASGGSLRFTTGTGPVLGSGRIEVRAMQGLVPLTNKRSVDLAVDPIPLLDNPTLSFNGVEDEPGILNIRFLDDSLSDVTYSQVVTSSILNISAASRPSSDLIRLSLLSAPDAYGSTSIRLTLTDLLGPTDIIIPVTIAPTNDPPVATLSALPVPTMDPAVGTPVALLSRLDIGRGVDADVTLANATARLGFIAEVSGSDGVDLLSLRGDAGYRVDAGTIAVLPAGTAIATWTASGTRRIDVALTAAGTQAQLQELARLLRYSHAQNPVAPLTRTLSVTVVEPDPAGGTDSAATVTCPVRVAAVNRPPEVTLRPIELEPLRSAPLDISLADNDGLAALTVSVIAPLPGGGSIEPASCSGTVAAAGGMRYIHGASDLSDDRITLAVSDGRSAPVIASTTVAIRVRPDRLSIISDPLLEAVRGQTTGLDLATVPAGASLALAAYGAPLPPRPAGVSLSGSRLVLDWAQIPAGTSWIALAVEASTTDTAIPAGRRTARQRMLVRVRDPLPAGSAN